MKAKLKLLEEKINALELRERVIVCITVLVIVFGLFDQFWFSPHMGDISMLKEQHSEYIGINQDNKNTILILETRIAIDPNNKIKKEISQAELNAKRLDDILMMSSAGLISPERMLPVLGEVLGKESGLRLVEMSNTAAMPVSGKENILQLALFKHGLELNFIGSFKNVKEYIHKLEDLNEKIYLDEVSYQLTDYPLGEFKLKAHTLSVYEALISG